MGILKGFGIWIVTITSLSVYALEPEEALEIRKNWDENGYHKEHCSVTSEYKKTLDFLRSDAGAMIPDLQSRQIAEAVVKGCNGSAERFRKGFLTLQKSGVSLQKTVDVALVLSRAHPATVNNFYEVFKKLYLKEFFDFDYKTSFEATLDLSIDYRGNLDNALQDFNKLSNFCLDNKKLGLSVIQCSELSLQIAKLSQFYKKGVYDSFQKVYSALRDDDKFALSVRDALIQSEKVLRHGPRAVDNFIEAYEFAISKSGHAAKSTEALAFAHRMAALSHRGEEPPLFPGEHMLPDTFSK